MKKIGVSFYGCPYGLDALKSTENINGIVGVFDTILTAYQTAEEHLKKWIRSYEDNSIGLRPIVPYGQISSWEDPSKVQLYASGGWGDSIFMNYKFEFVEG